ncbi:MAG TPA: hypothetical protein VFZ48_02040 [Candidatus Saccharimonadales bacterium]
MLRSALLGVFSSSRVPAVGVGAAGGEANTNRDSETQTDHRHSTHDLSNREGNKQGSQSATEHGTTSTF